MTELLRYDAACRAIAEARAIDDVKGIRDQAEALRHYARQAKNRQSEIDMAEVRFRAELRIGEIKRDLRQKGQLHEGGRPKKSDKKTPAETAEVSKVRLSDYDIDDKLSARADAYLATGNSFDRLVERWRKFQEKSSGRVSLDLLKEDRDEKRKAENAIRFQDGCTVDDLHRAADQGQRFATILADPPWKFLTRSEKGDGRSAGQHYRTDAMDVIKKLPVQRLAAADCVLFMWIVDWCPHWAMEIIEAWGFTHKTTAFTWAKENASGEGWFMGQGFWTRANPEDCWLATRGSPKRLDASIRQLIVAPVMEHSRKPDEAQIRIEKLVAGPRLELYARRERRGWATWGNQIAAASFANMAAADPDTGEIVEAEPASEPVLISEPSNEAAEINTTAATPNPQNALTPAPAEVPPESPEGIPDFLRRESVPVVSASSPTPTPTTAG